ncbi:hypothetical protein H2204_005079 [Knufia peltigerae]|uniref:Aminoglycoside phosphotransferase domain-containing protein n=1 Tax=Knufia peltigerae TaxID=1002370 RepID=A0AA39D098_9EURO|nr:hypothetical protein H2204_005079 [Knufia peltigerae]
MASENIPYLSSHRDIQHRGTEHLAINNNFLRRSLALLALKTTARFYDQMGSCVPISKKKLIKMGPFVHLTEAATMKFVTEHTSIPVPKVFCSFVHKNIAYLVMERYQGDELPTAWKKLSERSRHKVFDQLKRMLQELRALKPPHSTKVQSSVGGSLRDSRLPRSCPRFGPFDTIQEFHLWLRDGLQPSQIKGRDNDPDWQEIQDMATEQDGPWPPPVFTHGDLNPFNILLRGDQVVGLIDWEMSGWYPNYWEYTSEWLTSEHTRTEWRDSIHWFLDPFPRELKMEATRQKWWGE